MTVPWWTLGESVRLDEWHLMPSERFKVDGLTLLPGGESGTVRGKVMMLSFRSVRRLDFDLETRSLVTVRAVLEGVKGTAMFAVTRTPPFDRPEHHVSHLIPQLPDGAWEAMTAGYQVAETLPG